MYIPQNVYAAKKQPLMFFYKEFLYSGILLQCLDCIAIPCPLLYIYIPSMLCIAIISLPYYLHMQTIIYLYFHDIPIIYTSKYCWLNLNLEEFPDGIRCDQEIALLGLFALG